MLLLRSSTYLRVFSLFKALYMRNVELIIITAIYYMRLSLQSRRGSIYLYASYCSRHLINLDVYTA